MTSRHPQKPGGGSQIRAPRNNHRTLYLAILSAGLALSASQANAATLPTHALALFSSANNPFSGFLDNFSTFMTGTVARTGSVAAVVVTGLMWAFGAPHAKTIFTSVACGVGLANAAPTAISWFTGN